MLKGLVKIFRRVKRDWEAFQIEISTYRSPECEACPRAVFAEQWVFQNMSIETFQKIQPYFHLTQWVFFRGWGDPLENPELIAMLRLAKQSDCKTGLTTNGLLLNPDLSSQLLTEGLDLLEITFESAIQNVPESLRGGSEFKRILENVQELMKRRKEGHRNHPKMVLSFVMTRLNMTELSQVVPLAAQMGVDELTFTHLDYLPNERCNLLRAFYHESRTPAFEQSISEIHELGKKHKVSVRTAPLQAKEVMVCEPNPPEKVFFAVDGSLAPCPYLRIPKRGDLPRIFLHKKYTVPQTSFGNIHQEDFLTIWNKEPYKNFRKIFEERRKSKMGVVNLLNAFSGGRPSGSNSAPPEPPPPFPDVCRTCYKAYGI